jgi:hypothetical protein
MVHFSKSLACRHSITSQTSPLGATRVSRRIVFYLKAIAEIDFS